MSKFRFEDLQPHVEMLIDALENRGASNSGMPDITVYPYAEKYRDMLKQIRQKTISKYYLDRFLNTNFDEIMTLTTQKHRVENLLHAIKIYFYKEFMTR
jgi:hypothetical protein